MKDNGNYGNSRGKNRDESHVSGSYSASLKSYSHWKMKEISEQRSNYSYGKTGKQVDSSSSFSIPADRETTRKSDIKSKKKPIVYVPIKEKSHISSYGDYGDRAVFGSEDSNTDKKKQLLYARSAYGRKSDSYQGKKEDLQRVYRGRIYKKSPKVKQANFVISNRNISPELREERRKIIRSKIRERQKSKFRNNYIAGIKRAKHKLRVNSRLAAESTLKLVEQEEVGKELSTFGKTATIATYRGSRTVGRTVYRSAKGSISAYRGIKNLPGKAKATYKGIKNTVRRASRTYKGIKQEIRNIRNNYKRGQYSITAMKRMMKKYIQTFRNSIKMRKVMTNTIKTVVILVKFLVKMLVQTLIYIMGFLTGICGLVIIFFLLIIVIIASIFGGKSDDGILSYEGTHGIATNTYSVLMYDSKGVNFAFSNVDSDFNMNLASLYQDFWKKIADDYKNAETSTDPDFDNIYYKFLNEGEKEYINALDIYILMATYYGASVEQPYNGIEVMNVEQEKRLKDWFWEMNSFTTEDVKENPYLYTDPITGAQETIYEYNHYIIITNKKFNDVKQDFLTSEIICQYGTLVLKQLRMYQMENKFKYYFNNRTFTSDIHIDLTDVSKPELYFTFSGKRNAYPVH